MLNKQKSKKARDAGIETAITNAEAKYERWKEKALCYVQEYPARRFMTEDVREWAYKRGLARPPHEMAWGGVMVTAKGMGIVTHGGFDSTSNPKAHRTPASVWVK